MLIVGEAVPVGGQSKGQLVKIALSVQFWYKPKPLKNKDSFIKRA